ncbi:MAG: hypothetical protein QHG98_07405 [Methanothrix sp.]|jgi:hypothetical protein|nr:hypothetical protein [Methanothrix sp.]
MGLKVIPSVNVFIGKDVVVVADRTEVQAKLIGTDDHYIFLAVCNEDGAHEYVAIPHGRVRMLRIKP